MELDNHRIVFNKFPVKDNHLILVAKKPKSQYTHLNIFEISELILLQNYVNGIVFFNGGKKSGSSQPRKHIQCIPIENISKEEFGIFKIFNKHKNEFFQKVEINNFFSNLENKESDKEKNFLDYIDILTLKNFKKNSIPHFFVDLSNLKTYFNNDSQEEILKENIEEYSKIIFNVYLNVLDNLNLIHKENIENELSCNNDNLKKKILNDYSFLFTENWFYVIPRNSDCVEMKNGNLYLNSNSYTFSLLIKSEELEKEIEEVDIIKDIYTKL